MGHRRALIALTAAVAALPQVANASPVVVEVTPEDGRAATAARQLAGAGVDVERRGEDLIQVSAEPEQISALSRLPAVASANQAATAFGDAIETQGLKRTGAAAFEPIAGGGSGLIIAVLDLGFGPAISTLQAQKELPPPPRLTTATFDPLFGLAGRNAYGNPTNHGELVAQTVFDYAPKARYVFANYRTRSDFVAAVDWLTRVKPNIVVHSNSFLEGPFDGTGPEARAVDRAAAAGILWFNSAGNYAQRHWEGDWTDADEDGALDLGNGSGEWNFDRALADPTTFAVSWTSGEGEVADLSLEIQRREADGRWTTVARADDNQAEGARASERITGYRDPVGGTFRIRIAASGAVVPERVTVFSREIDLAEAGGDEASSQPGPGDAAGAISVGAVDWRGDARKKYSSVGPTDDGRSKPDLVAPTNTRVMGKISSRAVGGTSNAAPNAAGAAAMLMGALRRAGLDYSAAAVRARLFDKPLDLGTPGVDDIFGAGRVRVEIDPPVLNPEAPDAFKTVRGRPRIEVETVDASELAKWQLFVDRVAVTPVKNTARVGARLDTRRLSDGWHLIRAEATDWPGNSGAAEWWLRVDNTRPTLTVRRVRVAARRRIKRPESLEAGRRAARARTNRKVRVMVAARDNFSGRLTVGVRVLNRRGKRVGSRSLTIRPGAKRWITVGKLPRGRYRVQLLVRDRAGNPVSLARRVLVR